MHFPRYIFMVWCQIAILTDYLGKRVLSSPKCPHLRWGPSNIVFNCYYVSLPGIKLPEPGKDYPFPYRLAVKHSCSFSSAPHIRLYDTVLNQHTNKFTRAIGYFLLVNNQDLLWGPPNLTLNRHRLYFPGLKRTELDADHSTLPSVGWGLKINTFIISTSLPRL